MDQSSSNTGGQKIRTSCDRCQAAKLKCSRTKPACSRCVKGGHECVYSPYKRIGRPPTSTSSSESNVQTQAQAQQQRSKSSQSPNNLDQQHDVQQLLQLQNHVQDWRQSNPHQDNFQDQRTPTSVISLQKGADPASLYNETIVPGHMTGGSGPSGGDVDAVMHMATDQPWPAASSPWPANNPLTAEDTSMFDSMLDLIQFDLENLPAAPLAMDGFPVSTFANPSSQGSSQITPGTSSTTDSLTSASRWEADLFGDVAVPLQTVSTHQSNTVTPSMDIATDGTSGMENRFSPSFDVESSQNDAARNGSVGSISEFPMIDQTAQHERGNASNLLFSHHHLNSHLRGSPSSSTSSAPPHSFQIQGSPPRPVLMSQNTRDDFAKVFTAVPTPLVNREDPVQCGNACYSVLLEQLMRLVDCDGGNGLSLDVLLSMNRSLKSRKERALLCANCTAQSSSRVTLVLMIMAVNSLVGLFEQKLNPPEKKDEDDDDSDERQGAGRTTAWPNLGMTARRKDEGAEYAKAEGISGSTLRTEKPLMAGTFQVEGSVKAKFLHELLSVSFEELTSLLSELDHATTVSLRGTNYKVTREMLGDLPRRIFFMRGRLAMAGSTF